MRQSFLLIQIRFPTQPMWFYLLPEPDKKWNPELAETNMTPTIDDVDSTYPW